GPETYQDDIILDQTPPAIDGVRAAARGSGEARRCQMRIRASDELSGVAQMQITNDTAEPRDLVPFRRRQCADSQRTLTGSGGGRTVGATRSWRQGCASDHAAISQSARMKRLARRKFLSVSAMTALGVLAGPRGAAPEAWAPKPARTDPQGGAGAVTLFVCGDVMTGRGIDQVLPHPSDPLLHEPYVRSALDYVELATRPHGPIPRAVDFAYPWGDALAELVRAAPEVRIVNLETAVTRSDARLPKRIHSQM